MYDNEMKNLLIQFRRDLHRIPELDRDLPKTTAYIKDYLANLPCTLVDVEDAGFVAFFQVVGATSTIAFRTDMDALPVTEYSNLPFSSEHPGQMHACGHDGHMSIMLGFATEISERMHELKQNVLLIFQAAEEASGGAKVIAQSGVLEKVNVEKVFGIHLWPSFPRDTIICREGDFMAATIVFSVDMKGKSAHVATYHKGIDALELGCDFVKRIYEMEKTEISPDVHRLLRIGVFESGKATNVVSDTAHLEGTLRCYSENVFNRMWGRIVEIAEDITSKRRCQFSFSKKVSYPAVINPKPLFKEARKTLMSAGYSFHDLELPLLVSEDFSYYQQRVPGVFFHLGTGLDLPLHRGDYTIDEDVLITGVGIYKTLLGLS